MCIANHCADRVRSDVDRQCEEARRDELLCPSFGRWRVQTASREQPDHNEPSQRLDQGVGSEPDQGEIPATVFLYWTLY
jgi:hypothetical protein